MPSNLVRRVERELKDAGDPKRAAGSKTYLKSDLTFYGANLAAIRATAGSIVKKEPLEHGRLEELGLEL